MSSVFKGKMSLVEKVDLRALQLIHDNFVEVFERMGKKIKIQGKEDGVFRYVSDLKQAETLIETFLLAKKKSNIVNYKYTGKLDYGRRFHCSPSLQECPRPIRHAIAKDIYYDIDIKNAHPVFLYDLCEKMDFPHPVLKTYVKGDREAFLKTLYGVKFSRKVEETDDTITMEEVEVSCRDDAKALFLSILNGGGSTKTGNEALDDFYKQQQLFLKSFYDLPENDKYKKRAEKAYKSSGKQWDNRKGSALNYYLCEVENNVLTAMEEFLQSQKVSYGTFCFDGLMIYRKDVKDLPLLLEGMEGFVSDKVGFPITITSKEMDEDVDLTGLRVKDDDDEEDIEMKEIPWENDMEYNHPRVIKYCDTFRSKRGGSLEALRRRIYEYMDHFFCTIEGSQQYVIREVFHLVNGRRLKKYYVPMKDWRAYCKDKTVFSKFLKGEDGKPLILFNMEAYLFQFERRKYPSLGFYPKLDADVNFYNSFTGFDYYDDGKAVDDEAIRPFLDHIFIYWCNRNQASYLYTLKLFALWLQKPHVKSRVAMVIRSDDEGAGKGIIFNYFSRIMGAYDDISGTMGCWRQIHDADKIFGRFNSMLEGACVLWLDEALWAGDKKNVGKLLGLITEPSITVERKGFDSYTCQSYVNMIMTSNSEWIVPASSSSRRFFVLDVDNSLAGVQTAESTAYFNKLASVPVQDLANFFFRLDISDFNPQMIPQTEALLDQKLISMPSSHRWVLNMMETEEVWDTYVEGLQKEAIFQCYMNWCKENNEFRCEQNNIFWRQIGKLFGKVDSRVRVAGDRVRMCSFPVFKESIRMFATVYRTDEKWVLNKIGRDDEDDDELVIEVHVEEEELVIEVGQE
jgi:hypothetical protein